MASTFPVSLCLILFPVLIISLSARDDYGHGEDNPTHLHFYFHNVVTGPNPATHLVHPGDGKNGSPVGFGLTVITDDPLTDGPDLNSTLVGRAQGLYALATPVEEMGLLMAVNFVFEQGKYSGSSLAILGRNGLFEKVREMPVVGGTGIFRMARGYALARTHWYNQPTGDATTEYDVYVFLRGSMRFIVDTCARVCIARVDLDGVYMLPAVDVVGAVMGCVVITG